MAECKCKLAQKLVGDGCEACNPAKALDYAKDTIEDLRARVTELEDALRHATCGGRGYFTHNGIVQAMPRKVAVMVRKALAD